MAEVLSALQLRRLTEHKYSAEGSSLLEPYMQTFWRWLVEQIPLTWAPNSITLAGLIVNVLTTCILMYYSPDARQDVSILTETKGLATMQISTLYQILLQNFQLIELVYPIRLHLSGHNSTSWYCHQVKCQQRSQIDNQFLTYITGSRL